MSPGQHTPSEPSKAPAPLRAVPPSVPGKPDLDKAAGTGTTPASAVPKRNDLPDQPVKNGTLRSVGASASPKPAGKPAAKKAVAAKPAADPKKKVDAKGKGKPAKDPKPTKEELEALAKRKEIDLTKLSPEKALKRLDAIYKKEKVVERKQASFDLASRARRAAKADLEQAQDELAKEIQDQRFGPGPLFNADGTGPAGAPQGKA